ncbi:type IV pili methyl-accepting chemotaxis transducer N-terminal domain-containing protein [Aureivirga sp. CE67]|uniref:type IV pili methyl-accepting chemotaxis transducer N-terminal domain-containing protein n=1 Tax=Aureivirga sp. CE67 TaxID=1788983 RepID=UPI0018CBA341|nr:type IV pili methyl-accepting chemotaxis transducer N-terminal domain-containing protein [Aureivirga sp. CE67]
MKKIILIFVISFLTQIGYSQISNGEAINIAGKQRMISQRMLKCYMMIGADIKTDQARKELDESVAAFEEGYLLLSEYASSGKVSKSLDEVRKLWEPFRLHIVSTPNHKDASLLLEEADKLLTASQDVVEEIENHLRLKSAKLVDKAGRQRMLSQKIAMYYIAHYWKVPNNDLYVNLVNTTKEYEQALIILNESELNTEEIDTNLKKINSQWAFSKKTFDPRSDRLMPSVVVVTTNAMLKNMDNITGLYAALVE